MRAVRNTRASSLPREGFRAFFDAHYAFVWRTARRLGAPPGALDDVVQDVFLAVVRSGEAFEGRSRLKTWLWAVTANTVKMHRRKEARRRKRKDLAGGLVVARGHSDQVERHAAVDLIDRLVRKLDPPQRTVFLLIELEDVEPKEVAQMFGVSVNTVHSRLRLARKRLAMEVRRLRARERRTA
ncbi:MAG: RNA polymerase sigma factor [Myxococcota bacterium]